MPSVAHTVKGWVIGTVFIASRSSLNQVGIIRQIDRNSGGDTQGSLRKLLCRPQLCASGSTGQYDCIPRNLAWALRNRRRIYEISRAIAAPPLGSDRKFHRYTLDGCPKSWKNSDIASLILNNSNSAHRILNPQIQSMEKILKFILSLF